MAMKGIFLFDSSDRLVISLLRPELEVLLKQQISEEAEVLDSNLISHLLLPILFAHKIYSAIAEDFCQSVSSDLVEFAFFPYHNRFFILVYDVRSRYHQRERQGDIDQIKNICDLIMGPLSDVITERQFPEQFELLKQSLKACLYHSGSPLNLASIRSVKPPGMISLLNLLNQEMTTFVDVQIGMIVEDNQILAFEHRSCPLTVSPKFLESIIRWSSRDEDATSAVVRQGLWFTSGLRQKPVDIFTLELTESLHYVVVCKVLNEPIIVDLLSLKQQLHRPLNPKLIEEVDKVLVTLKRVLEQTNLGPLVSLRDHWDRVNLAYRSNAESCQTSKAFNNFYSFYCIFVIQFLRTSQRTGVNYRRKVMNRLWNRLSSCFRVRQALSGYQTLQSTESFSLHSSSLSTYGEDLMGLLFLNLKDNFCYSIPASGDVFECLKNSLALRLRCMGTALQTDQLVVCVVTSPYLRSNLDDCVQFFCQKHTIKDLCNLQCIKCYGLKTKLLKLLETEIACAAAFGRSVPLNLAFQTTVRLTLRWLPRGNSILLTD